MLNLAAIAEGNSQRWEKSFCDLASSNASLADFARWVELNSRIAVNRSWFTVARMLDGESLKNHYEIAREKVAREGGSVEAHLKGSLKGFYKRRMAFDHAFEGGEAFRYGTLNGGCVGIEKFGPLCLIFSQEAQDAFSKQACLLPGDSLLLCTSAAGTLDEPRVFDLTGAFQSRAKYVSTHRITRISATKGTWPAVLLDARDLENGYIEVVFMGTVSIKSIERVRLSKAASDAAWNAVFSAHAPNATISNKARVEDLTRVLKAEKSNEIQLEILS